MTEKGQQVYRVAHQLYTQNPDWVTFFREVLGLEGVVRQAYPRQEDMAEFERTDTYDEIQHMLAKLRERSTQPSDDEEPTRVITVRMPKSLHEALKIEARDRQTSMNKLCITKLLQSIREELVPHEV